MKRGVTLILSVVIIGVGIWIMRGTQTLNAACSLNGGTSCVSGLPFDLLGIALATTGGVSIAVQLITAIRSVRRRSVRREYPAITTLHEYEVESLRDVA